MIDACDKAVDKAASLSSVTAWDLYGAEPIQKRAEAIADGAQRVAAFLHHERRQTKRAHQRAAAREVPRLHFQYADRIEPVRIEAERDDQNLRREGANFLIGRLDRRNHRVAAGAMRERQVEVEALASAAASLRGIAGEERIIIDRIGVDGNRQHVRAIVENLLRAVAVMGVDIEDRDARMTRAQPLRGDRGVVEIAKAGGAVGARMMARGAAER